MKAESPISPIFSFLVSKVHRRPYSDIFSVVSGPRDETEKFSLIFDYDFCRSFRAVRNSLGLMI
jgi:hypothetical protein